MYNELLLNIDKIHTTKMGRERLLKNLKINTDPVLYCKNKIIDSMIYKKGKNFYCVNS